MNLVVACLLSLSTLAFAASMEYRYWDWGRTPKRDDFQYAVLTMALDKTRTEFGPYTVQRIVADLSTARSRREVSEGVHVNVQAGPWRVLDKSSPLDQRIPVNVPIMAGLLGYRFLLIRTGDKDKFAAITEAAQLKALKAGQGRGWAELTLYRRNGYRVIDSADIKTLIPMLASRRFDYLPMSVTEVKSALELYPELGDQLMIAPNLMISYPLPTIFYVSAAEPALARRLERGLVLADRDGTLDDMVRQYFSKEIATLLNVTRHFTMEDPAISKSLLSQLPSPRRLSLKGAP